MTKLQPKDLLVHLEKGNRVEHHLKENYADDFTWKRQLSGLRDIAQQQAWPSTGGLLSSGTGIGPQWASSFAPSWISSTSTTLQ